MKRHARAVSRRSAGWAAQAAAPSTFTASGAKKEFGKVLELAMRGGRVFITKHATPKAVVLSVDDFTALTRATERTLDTLSGEFDALLTRMQTPRARAGLKAAFDASPNEIGAAAVAAARKRGCGDPTTLHLRAGANGAGKSSMAGAVIGRHRSEFFNPDAGARRIRERNPGISQAEANSAAWHEGRRLLERAITERVTYAFETTLGGATITALLER